LYCNRKIVGGKTTTNQWNILQFFEQKRDKEKISKGQAKTTNTTCECRVDLFQKNSCDDRNTTKYRVESETIFQRAKGSH
jgi:hypothetical protein